MNIRNAQRTFTGTVMGLIALVWFIPIYFMIINSFKPLKDVIFTTSAFPQSFYLENIVNVWKDAKYFTLFSNSFIITAISLLGIILFASMTGYRLARTRGKMVGLLMGYFILTLIIPFQAVMIPLVKTMKDFALINNRIGLVIVYIAFGSPMAIFLYHGYVKGVPESLEESAIIDGAGPFRTYFTIIFPLLAPMTSTIVILQSLFIWNDFLLPLITLQNEALKTIPLGIAGKFFGQYAFKWNLGITAMLLASLPMLILYLVMQRYIISGVVKGAVKG
jgi:raffinose/stachyose/melibiose transport system permease protein